MSKRAPILVLTAFVITLVAAAAFRQSPSQEKQKGVSWVGGPRPVGPEDLAVLAQNSVNWMVQTPFGWQRKHDSPEVVLSTSGRILWGESDEGLRTTTRLAKEIGIRTLLKPHIWLTDYKSGKWRSDIRMQDEESWGKWFRSYGRFMLHYAKLAQDTGIEALCIGTELRATVQEREADWRRLIAQIREVYDGRLTYAANWWAEFEEVPFWDELDAIGIQAYFPLTDKEEPSLEDLKRGWEPHVKKIEQMAARSEKPIVFTEIGYRSAPEAAIEPWKWTQHAPKDVPVDWSTQANAYEAFFQTFWERDWFAGAYFWKWYPRPRDKAGENLDFTPQHKPAERVMARWYSER